MATVLVNLALDSFKYMCVFMHACACTHMHVYPKVFQIFCFNQLQWG